MPSHSALARIQQFTTLTLIALSIGWAVLQWPRSPPVAIGGAVAIALSHLGLLAFQFTMLMAVGEHQEGRRPSGLAVLRAWLTEAWYAALVFGWRQPFAWRRVPDHVPAAATGVRGVVLIHGFACNRGFWNPWMRSLRARGVPYIAVNLEPVFGSIDDYAAIIDGAVRRLAAATGRPPLVVGHSMGGLAARAWLRACDGASRAHHVVTIGTPHAGTWLARFSRMKNARQMRQRSGWIEALAPHTQGIAPGFFTCWYSDCDNVVFPTLTATLPGADNRFVPGAAHVDLAFHPEVVRHTMALATAP
jgi:pimeloyl-ACP methyl ester carboxylesterase